MSGDPLKGNSVIFVFKKFRSEVIKEDGKRLTWMWRSFRNVWNRRRRVRKKNYMVDVCVVLAVLAGSVHASCEGETFAVVGIGFPSDAVGMFEGIVGSVSGINAGSRVSWAFDAMGSDEDSGGNGANAGEGVVESFSVYTSSRAISGND
jgi:hypothetical protein